MATSGGGHLQRQCAVREDDSPNVTKPTELSPLGPGVLQPNKSDRPLVELQSPEDFGNSASQPNDGDVGALRPRVELQSSNDFSRCFVLPCHNSCPDGSFPLEDLAVGRIDLVARCISAAMFLSFGVRRNTEIRVALHAPKIPNNSSPELSKTVVISGAAVKHLRPSERVIGSLIKRALGGAPVKKNLTRGAKQ